MTISDVQGKILMIVKIDLHKRDAQLKNLFTELGPLVEADRQKPPEVLGFPELNEVSPATMAVLKKIDKRCDEGYDFNIL